METNGRAGYMIRSKVADLRRKKAFDEKRDLSVRTMAQETGLAVGTVQRLVKGDTERVYLSTLNTLCHYFGVKHIGDILEFVPDEAQPPQA